MPRSTARYGRKSDLADHRDYGYTGTSSEGALPKLWNLTPHMPPIYDQGPLGSCTGNGWARVMEYRAILQNEAPVTPSRLFIYYNERVEESSPVDQDAGAEIRTGAKVVSTYGAPPESDWPYDISRFAEKPPEQAYTDGKQHEALQYQRIVIGPGAPMRTAISRGLPIVFGFSVPDYFESGWNYNTPLSLPTPDTQIVGGHCVVITAYDWSCTRFSVPAFQCDNSWGPDWGLDGRFWMDYRWFNPNPGLANDMWVVSKVT